MFLHTCVLGPDWLVNLSVNLLHAVPSVQNAFSLQTLQKSLIIKRLLILLYNSRLNFLQKFKKVNVHLRKEYKIGN